MIRCVRFWITGRRLRCIIMGDELHSYREGSACTYGFKASARHGDAQYLVEGNKLAFRYGGRDYYFNIMKVVKTEYVVEVVAYSMMFELLNEDAGEYKSPKAMSFQEYLDVFDPEHTLELGVNEVEDKMVSRTESNIHGLLIGGKGLC